MFPATSKKLVVLPSETYKFLKLCNRSTCDKMMTKLCRTSMITLWIVYRF